MDSHPLRDLLTARGIKVVDAAASSDVHFTALYEILAERVDPRLSTLRKLTAYARTLDPSVTMDQLFGGEAR